MGLIISLVRSTWVVSYAAFSLTSFILTGFAVFGERTPNRVANVVLSLTSNQYSEFPLIVFFLDLLFQSWLSVTDVSPLARLFSYVNVITAAGIVYLFKRSLESQLVAENFLGEISKENKMKFKLPGVTSLRFWKQFMNPFHWPSNFTLNENIPYWTSKEQMYAMHTDGWESVLEMAVDVYRPDNVEGGHDRPVLMYIHGGGWTSGSKKLLGPLVTEMIAQNWVVVAVNHRLKTKDGYPTQLIDCKRALRWIREEVQTFGGDPYNVVVAGDSSGGQLAAMLALTPNDPAYQHGFEKLVDANDYSAASGRERFIKEVALRPGFPESAENIAFLKEHSPLYKVEGTNVPFLVVQGDLDMCPVETARDFVKEFRKKSTASINYLEIPGGHHCFEMFSSPRTWYTTIATAEWLNHNFNQTATNEKKVARVHELVEWWHENN
ncbi:alpha/beta-hydrolase [Linnemannia elongata AG-77]|uniref:Alpha/beta-hydrolase n=1 Tax=Linnemannia elongata AG-77 TaxID=1314771 RepID=A0A197KA46_9FUNG|nr:alpha/beta-hydrolase [Linnemannia elongata AG-77]